MTGIALPDDATKANLDSGSDAVKNARTELALLVDKFNTLKGEIGSDRLQWPIELSGVTYASATSFTVSDATDCHVGRTVQISGATTGTVYGPITGVSGTTIAVSWATLSNETLTAWLGAVSAGSVSSLPAVIATGSTEPRTLADHLGDYVNVLNYMTFAERADVAAGTASVDVSAAIQAAIDYVAGIGGGTVFIPSGGYLISNTLTIDDNGVALKGAGQGALQGGIAALRASAATRIVFDSSAIAVPMVRFTSVDSEIPKVGGGMDGIMLDANGKATICLEIRSWRYGTFRNLHLYAATEDNLLLRAFSGSLSANPYDVQKCLFENIYSHFKNQVGNTAYALRLTGGQGNGGTTTGNASFNTFINCQFQSQDQDAIYLEDTDNNYFFGCSANSVTPGYYSVVFGSGDQDSSGGGSPARYNQFHGGEYGGGIHARAGQSGGSSSNSNLVFGYNYSNGAVNVTIEAPAGGSDTPSLMVFSSDAAEFFNALNVVIADSRARATEARAALNGEALRIKSGSSNHMVFDGTESWGINVHGPSGNLRIQRLTGGGVVDFGGVAPQFGTHTAIGAETVTGYITITDESGNPRKLAVVS